MGAPPPPHAPRRAARAVTRAARTLRPHPCGRRPSARAAQTPELERHSTYKEADLQACVRDIHELHKNASANSLQAVRKKYAQEKHGGVSSIAPANLRW